MFEENNIGKFADADFKVEPDVEAGYETVEVQKRTMQTVFEAVLSDREKGAPVVTRALRSSYENILGAYSVELGKDKAFVTGRLREIFERHLAALERFDFATLADPNAETPLKVFLNELYGEVDRLTYFAAQLGHVGDEILQYLIKEYGYTGFRAGSPGESLSISEVIKRVIEKEKVNENSPRLGYLTKLLDFQTDLERNVREIFSNHAPGSLERGEFAGILEEIQTVASERVPKNRDNVYFPVGITKEMRLAEEAVAGKRSFERPLDMYSFLLWLDSVSQDLPEGKYAQLVVCDEAQVPNYMTKFGVSDADARISARAIGSVEVEYYEDIIKALGLEKIQVIPYQEFVEKNKESFELWHEIVTGLAAHPLFETAFTQMGQASVDKNASEEDKREYLKYALEELANILSADGLKVSHQKEARYDALAMVLKHISEKNVGISKAEVFSKTNTKEFLEVFDEVVQGLLIAVKNKGETVDQKAYYKGVESVLEQLKKDLKSYIRDKNIKEVNIQRGKEYQKFANALVMDFVVPAVGSRSMGKKTAKGGNKEYAVTHKEPYTAYFPENILFLDADQVIASVDPAVIGKALALPHEKQLQYFYESIRPTIVRFVAHLDTLPKTYWDEVETSDYIILRDCKNIATVAESVLFVQKYIVSAVNVQRMNRNHEAF